MQDIDAGGTDLRVARLVLLASVCVILYVALSGYIDVYRFAVTGALYEILWLPVLVSTPVLPAISFIRARRAQDPVRRYYLLSLVISISNLVLIAVKTR